MSSPLPYIHLSHDPGFTKGETIKLADVFYQITKNCGDGRLMVKRVGHDINLERVEKLLR